MTNLRSIDLNLLPVLHALLREGQVTAASRQLNLSQPATSAALGRLRILLGNELLVRKGGGMALTRYARELLPRIEALMAELGDVLRPEPAFDPATSGRAFRILVNDYAAHVVLPPLASRLARSAPGVVVNARALDDDFDARLSSADYDLAVRDEWSMAGAPRIETLFDESFACIARRGHPWLVEGRMDLDRFAAASHVLIAPERATPGPVDVALAAHGLERRVTVTLPHFLAAPAIVAATDNVMTIASRVATAMADRYGLRIFPPPITVSGFRVAMAWPVEADGDPGAAWFRDQVREAAGVPGDPSNAGG